MKLLLVEKIALLAKMLIFHILSSALRHSLKLILGGDRHGLNIDKLCENCQRTTHLDILLSARRRILLNLFVTNEKINTPNTLNAFICMHTLIILYMVTYMCICFNYQSDSYK